VIAKVVDDMATLIESPTTRVDAAAESSATGLELFFQSLIVASKSALLLDFDGTLAPMRVDPSKVRPWAGVADLLSEIQKAGRTRLAIISGRPAQDVASQMEMRNPPEIWGLHGAERLYPDGRLELQELPVRDQALLKAAQSAVRENFVALRIEEKRNAVAVHWRGKPPQSREATKRNALALLLPFATANGVSLLQFDGGIELRIGRDKGDAVRMILEEMPANTPVAYLGDDTTDEDAFHALTGRGLSVLVRRQWRPGAAQVWLRPPAQLREFLATWLRVSQI
jgi:trehalose 6-phosphate phosphatase